MAAKPTIAIVGPGNLGSALGAALHEAGYRIREIVSKTRRESGRKLAQELRARIETPVSARLDVDVVWFCVPDRAIAAAAQTLAGRAEWERKIALHSSGALASDELAVLRHKGARVGSLHPLMTFVLGSRPGLRGVPFGFEGDRAAARMAERIVHDLHGEMFVIPKRSKAAYHTWGAFTSPLLLAALVTAEEVAELAGIDRRAARRRMLPIVRQTIENYALHGPEGAFSGPLIRGDVDTVARHLKALQRLTGAREVYMALARSGLRNLPVRNRKALQKILK